MADTVPPFLQVMRLERRRIPVNKISTVLFYVTDDEHLPRQTARLVSMIQLPPVQRTKAVILDKCLISVRDRTKLQLRVLTPVPARGSL